MFQSVPQLVENAIASRKAGDLRAAIDYLEQADRIDPADLSVLSLLSSYNVQRENFASAFYVLERALRLYPDHGSLHSTYAQALWGIKRFDSAIAHFRQALALHPTSSRWTMLGTILAEVGDSTEAIQCFNEALRIDPKNTEAMLNLALQVRYDRSEHARDLLQRAIDLDPSFCEAHRELGFEMIKVGNWRAAEEMLKKSLQLCPEHAWARIYLGHVFFRTRRLKEAEAEFLAAIQDAPLWSFPAQLAGNFFASLGRTAEACDYFDLARRLAPLDIDHEIALARFYVRIGDRHSAAAAVERALSIDPNYAIDDEIRNGLVN